MVKGRWRRRRRWRRRKRKGELARVRQFARAIRNRVRGLVVKGAEAAA
jgi:hypothetical protein